MNLTQQLKEETGYQWVIDRLAPASPFGKALARHPHWYGPDDRQALETELDCVSAALALPPRAADGVLHALALFHDVSGSLNRPVGAAMDDVELFQLKGFLLALERLDRAYTALPPFPGLALTPMEGTLARLDPSGRRLGAFSAAEFDPELLTLPRQEAEARELAVRRKLTDVLLADKALFQENFQAIGRLDLILAKSRLARRFHCVRPVIAPGPVEGDGLTHPKVAAHLREKGRDFTPISLSAPQGCTVITGANMGGKSVALATTALAILLAQTGFFVFGLAFRSPLFDALSFIATDGGSADRGLSSFGAEVRAVDTLLREQEGRRFFVALDEFARGTNPQEGAALARALVTYFNRLDCVALMTTHYDGVSDAAAAHYQVAGLDVDAPGEALSEKMDYRLLSAPPGAPCPKDAAKVCKLLNLTPTLLDIFVQND